MHWKPCFRSALNRSRSEGILKETRCWRQKFVLQRDEQTLSKHVPDAAEPTRFRLSIQYDRIAAPRAGRQHERRKWASLLNKLVRQRCRFNRVAFGICWMSNRRVEHWPIRVAGGIATQLRRNGQRLGACLRTAPKSLGTGGAESAPAKSHSRRTRTTPPRAHSRCSPSFVVQILSSAPLPSGPEFQLPVNGSLPGSYDAGSLLLCSGGRGTSFKYAIPAG